MLQEPPAWLTRSDATRQPMQRDRPGVHGHRQLEALALLLECSVAKAGLLLRVSSAAQKPSPFFVAAFCSLCFALPAQNHHIRQSSPPCCLISVP